MEIKPTYLSFEQNKWLKEKGYEINTKPFYQYNDKEGWKELVDIPKYYAQGCSICPHLEQWQVVEWLRVKHGIWIVVDTIGSGLCVFKITNWEENFIYKAQGNFNSPQQAYSAAFDYILKELI